MSVSSSWMSWVHLKLDHCRVGYCRLWSLASVLVLMCFLILSLKSVLGGLLFVDFGMGLSLVALCVGMTGLGC